MSLKQVNICFKEQITYALNNLLMSSIKQEDAPCSSAQHLATAIQILHRLVPEYIINDEQCKEELNWLLELNDIRKIMDNWDSLYNSNKELQVIPEEYLPLND